MKIWIVSLFAVLVACTSIQEKKLVIEDSRSSDYPSRQPSSVTELTAAIDRLNLGQKGGKGTVLVVVSAADAIPLANGKSHKTGYFLRELTDPLKEVLLAGYDVEFATPDGKIPTVDENSLKLAWYGFPKVADAEKRLQEAISIKDSIVFLNGSRAPESLSRAREKVKNYVGLLVPGGHAPMVDLRYDANLGAIIRYFHQQQKPMAFVCHGPIALLSTEVSNVSEKGWPFKGYRVSVVSTEDEKLLESNVIHPLIGKIAGKLVDYPDALLKSAGAVLATSPVAGTPSLAKDREVITAQNPAAATAVGKILIRSIEENLGSRTEDSPVQGISNNITLSDLASMDRKQLSALYSRGTAEKIPLGDTVGLGLIFSGHPNINYLSAYAWQGKIFRKSESGDVELVNKIFGYTEAAGYQVDARVKLAPSLFDKNQAIQLDYSYSEVKIARPIVDEIRKIGSNLYLGRVTFTGVDLGFFTLYFVE